MGRFSLRGTALVLLLSVGIPMSAAFAAEYANPDLLTSADGLKNKIERAATDGSMDTPTALKIIDVRKPDDFRGGHIPGAINIPYTDLTDPHAAVDGALKSDTALATLLGQNGISQSSRVVIYDDEGGFRGARLFWVLEYYGHRNVSLLNGGIQAWTKAGHQLASPGSSATADAAPQAAEVPPAAFSITRTPRRFASADTILNHRNDENTVVVDVRPAKMFADGHIPWAKNVPWKQNLAGDGMLKSADELLSHFAAHGIEPDKHVIIHCQTGEASAHSYFVMRVLGFPRVRTYHRSWAEWGSDPSLPHS